MTPERQRQYRATEHGRAVIRACGVRFNRTLKGRYRTLTTMAKRREIPVELTIQEYNMAAQGKCHYCSGSLPKAGHGLDRIDSSVGYRIDNVVPCCSTCNYGKHKMNQKEFKDWILKVYLNFAGGS